MQGAVFLPSGSMMMFSCGIRGTCLISSSAWLSPVTIRIFSSEIRGAILSIVSWIRVIGETISRRCLGILSLLFGQKRVPLPPAMITAYIGSVFLLHEFSAVSHGITVTKERVIINVNNGLHKA
jgi:hypothetical protein